MILGLHRALWLITLLWIGGQSFRLLSFPHLLADLLLGWIYALLALQLFRAILPSRLIPVPYPIGLPHPLPAPVPTLWLIPYSTLRTQLRLLRPWRSLRRTLQQYVPTAPAGARLPRSPMAWSLPDERILLSRATLQLPPLELLGLLAHEQAHLRHADPLRRAALLGPFLMLTLSLNAYFPLLSWTVIILLLSAVCHWTEYAADHAAAQAVGRDPVQAVLTRLIPPSPRSPFETALVDSLSCLTTHPSPHLRLQRLFSH